MIFKSLTEHVNTVEDIKLLRVGSNWRLTRKGATETSPHERSSISTTIQCPATNFILGMFFPQPLPQPCSSNLTPVFSCAVKLFYIPKDNRATLLRSVLMSRTSNGFWAPRGSHDATLWLVWVILAVKIRASSLLATTAAQVSSYIDIQSSPDVVGNQYALLS